MSSLGGPAERISLIEMGADDYIEKPYDQLELLARVRAFFRRNRALGPIQPTTWFDAPAVAEAIDPPTRSSVPAPPQAKSTRGD